MIKHPGLMRLGADIAKELEREIEIREASRFESTTRERTSGPVPRHEARHEARHEDSGAHPTPMRRAVRGVRVLRPRAALAVGALAVAAAFALGFGLAHHSTPEQAGTAGQAAPIVDGNGAFTYEARGADGKAAVPAIGALVSETGGAVALAFSDGSRVSLEPKAEARVLRTTSRGATVLLERGRLAASVVHRGDTEWSFDAGPYEVHVVGTAFDLAWDPRHDALTLHMTEGKVTVSGCGTSQSVSAGEDLSVACDLDVTPPREHVPEPVGTAPSASAVQPSSGASPANAGSPGASPGATSPGATPGSTPSASPDASVASVAPVASVASASSAAPPPISPIESMDATTLWATADTARASGDAATAKNVLLVFRRRFRSDPRAGTAAFLLGTLAYDVENARAEGLGWFSIYLAENPNGALSREALGRAMEASIALDKKDDAQRFARRYLETHRGGPHTELATRVLGGNQP